MRLKLPTVVVGTAFALLVGASSAQATSISLATCHTGACGAVTGSVGLTYGNVLPINGTGIELTIANNTNGDVTELDLLFGGTVANNGPITLTGAVSPSYTTYTPSNVLNGGLMYTQTFSATYNAANLLFNVNIDLPPPPGSSPYRLAPGESITFWIAGLTEENFQNAMAHIQALPGDGSAKLTPSVPDGGATISLLGLAMLGLGYFRRRMA